MLSMSISSMVKVFGASKGCSGGNLHMKDQGRLHSDDITRK